MKTNKKKKPATHGGPRENSGGPRPGAGRKPKSEVATVQVGISLLPDAAFDLKQIAKERGASVSAVGAELLTEAIARRKATVPEV